MPRSLFLFISVIYSLIRYTNNTILLFSVFSLLFHLVWLSCGHFDSFVIITFHLIAQSIDNDGNTSLSKMVFSDALFITYMSYQRHDMTNKILIILMYCKCNILILHLRFMFTFVYTILYNSIHTMLLIYILIK